MPKKRVSVNIFIRWDILRMIDVITVDAYDYGDNYENDNANDFDFASDTPMCELRKLCGATGRDILAKPVLSQRSSA